MKRAIVVAVAIAGTGVVAFALWPARSTPAPQRAGDASAEPTPVRASSRPAIAGERPLTNGATITGHVVDIGGGPIAGAVIAVSPDETDAPPTSEAISDDNGMFSITDAPAGAVRLTCEADGYVPELVITSSPAAELAIALMPAGMIRGVAIRAGDRTPVAGARVWLEDERGALAGETRADDRGQFAIGQLMPGSYRVAASAPGWFGQRDGVLLGLAETTSPETVELFAAASVHGTVVIDGEGAPCTRGRVVLRRGNGNDNDGPYSMQEAALDDRGVARFDAVVPGDYDVDIDCEGALSAPGYPPVRVPQHALPGPDAAVAHEWRVRRGDARVRGVVVTPSGAPVASASVVIYGVDSTTTDAQGGFELSHLDRARYEIVASHIDFDGSASVTHDTREDATPRIVLTPGATLTGTVTDDAGPVANAMVVGRTEGTETRTMDDGRTLIMSSSITAALATTDLRGAFVARGLSPGRYQLVAAHSLWSEDDGIAADVTPVIVDLRVGDTTRVSLGFVRLRGRVTGQVVDERGRGISDAFVQADRAAATQIRFYSDRGALTDPDGRFALEGLPAGPLILRAFRRGGGESRVTGVQPGDHVTLAIAATAQIAGTARLPDGQPPLWLIVEARGADVIRTSSHYRTGGRWRIAHLPPGEFSITARYRDASASHDVTVRAGQTLTGLEATLAPEQ